MICDLKIHHVGYLVKNIAKSAALFEHVGYIVENTDMGGGIIYDKFRNVDICFMIKDGYRIELVSPKDSSSVVWELRKKIGNSPYHICYEVDDLKSAINELVEKNFLIFNEPQKAPAINERRVAFLVHAQMGMIELLEI